MNPMALWPQTHRDILSIDNDEDTGVLSLL
jgi:hypothetical protein